MTVAAAGDLDLSGSKLASSTVAAVVKGVSFVSGVNGPNSGRIGVTGRGDGPSALKRKAAGGGGGPARKEDVRKFFRAL